MNKNNLLWLLSLLMIVSVSFTSCNKDDDDDVDLKSAIIGTWKSVSIVYYVDGKDDEDPEISDDNDYGLVEFKSDGTFSSYYFYEGEKDNPTTGTWKIEGDKLITKSDKKRTYDNEEESEGRLSINGKTLMLTFEYVENRDGENEHTYKEVYTYARQ